MNQDIHHTEKKKDVIEVNEMVRWGLIIGIVFFAVLVYLISLVHFDIVRNPSIVTDMHIRVILSLVALYLTVVVVNRFIKYMAQYLNTSYLSRFAPMKNLGTFIESSERCSFVEKKYDHAVLFLHGFTASPQEFQFLELLLKANNINYYMPNVMGFGLDATMLLNKCRRHDWYRTCLNAYDALSNVAEKVSIVGHSFGGMLATYVAEHRSVHQLILTGPGFYSAPSDIKYKTLLTTAIISSLYIKLIPYLPKPIRKGRKTVSDILDESHIHRIFQYLALPMHSVREAFLMQDEVKIERARCDTLSIIYGKYDETVNMQRLLTELNDSKIKYQRYCMENSAHNVLEDFDRNASCQLVIDILRGGKYHPLRV